jgi:murein tripeptide amidase MpaA
VEDFIEFFRDPPEVASLKMLSWNQRELGGDGFVSWKPFDHPQLGRVELGGWKTKFTVQNPPPKFLRAECEKLSRFALSHAASAPHLLTHLETEELAQRLRRIELVVENAGYLPTHVTRVAADKKLVRPVDVRIELPQGAPRIRRAGGRDGTARRALSARRQQMEEPGLLREDAL